MMESPATDWLANISIKWVLAIVGALLLTRFALVRRRAAGRRVPESMAELVDSSLMALVLVFLVIRPFLVQAFYISSGSMMDTLLVGDRILVDKLAYRFHEPRPGDVILFVAPQRASIDEKDFVKRVVARPGDTVEVVPPRVLVDGRVVAACSSEASAHTFRGSAANDVVAYPALDVQRGVMPPRMDGYDAVVPRGPNRSVRVIAVPRLILRSEGPVVYSGTRRLATLSAPPDLDPQRRPEELGGDPSVRGEVVRVNGDPELIVVEGHTLSVDPGHVLVNGRALREPYLKEPPDYGMPPVTLAPGRYWVMGDNRNDSSDSHVWGPLERERIFGRVDALFWPITRLRWMAAP